MGHQSMGSTAWPGKGVTIPNMIWTLPPGNIERRHSTEVENQSEEKFVGVSMKQTWRQLAHQSPLGSGLKMLM
jgi:hypothetical protein